MAIVDLQRRIMEAGRIRIGAQTATSNGGSRPVKLETFRLTSADQRRIEQAAELFGGAPVEWAAPAGRQWEVVTTTDALAVIVPPSEMAFSQHYEMWSAGGCQRRCDGVTESIGDRPCACDPDKRECAIHTRLSVMLRDLPGLGVWRIDTSGYYAAVELSGAVQVIQAAAGRGALLPARLRLEQRTVKRQVDGKPQTRRFAVPVLDIEISPAQLLASQSQAPMLTDGAPDRAMTFTPVPAELPEGPGLSIAEQSQPPPPKPKRANAAPEIPRSGRQRGSPKPTTEPDTGAAREAPEEPDWDALIATYEAARDVTALWDLRKLAQGMRPNDGALLNKIAEAWQRAKAAGGAAPTQGEESPGSTGDTPAEKSQTNRLFALLRDGAVSGKDRDVRLRIVSRILNRVPEVGSFDELSAADVETVNAFLQRQKDADVLTHTLAELADPKPADEQPETGGDR